MKRFRIVAEVILMALALAACAAPDNRTQSERAADEALARRVEAALVADRYLDADHVEVAVKRGVVLVSGLVADDVELRGVLRICYAVPGVRDVEDQIQIFDFIHDSGGAESHLH